MTDNSMPQTFQIPPPAPSNALLVSNLNGIVVQSNVPAMGPPASALDTGLTTAMASILSTAQAAIAAYKPTT